jgi:hypothetical protein
MLNTLIFAVEVIWGGSLVIGLVLFLEDRLPLRAGNNSVTEQQSRPLGARTNTADGDPTITANSGT